MTLVVLSGIDCNTMPLPFFKIVSSTILRSYSGQFEPNPTVHVYQLVHLFVDFLLTITNCFNVRLKMSVACKSNILFFVLLVILCRDTTRRVSLDIPLLMEKALQLPKRNSQTKSTHNQRHRSWN